MFWKNKKSKTVLTPESSQQIKESIDVVEK